MNIEEAKKYITDESWETPGDDINEPELVINTAMVLDTLDQLGQPKPEVPRFVANWIEDQKQSFDDSSAIDMYENLTLDNHGGYYHDVWLWAIDHHNDFVFAWTYGYTVKKEKKYKVRDKRLSPNQNYLNFDKNSECWFFSNGVDTYSLIVKHTRKKLEESGFNVFDDDNYEVIEVTE
ncbi:DUF1642 domain-containing protein [Streptococcus canis]|uniref:DUF1642 domain-containing protein n=1 Tax=Streptococcus canis TaxID=1329 RepID=UPI00294939C6|nr:DUF1642 domain-containing protein [Streptococcus canis]MDV5989133.1 DUF1642 domain-containing protein [Streptococcus canis]